MTEASNPLTYHDFSQKLLDILLKIPALDDQQNREHLLWGLPHEPVTTIPSHGAKKTHLQNIIKYIKGLGQLTTGEWGLVIIAQNGLKLVEGTQLGSDLQDLLAKKDKLVLKEEPIYNLNAQPIPSNDYKYDLFLSYPHSKTKDWVLETFYPVLKFFLNNTLSWSAEICKNEEILPLSRHSSYLQETLAYSKCLIAICTPEYFRSEQCTYELATMLHRRNQIGEQASNMILTVRAFDGHLFPPLIKNMTFFDSRNYMIVGKGFHETKGYAEFQQFMHPWVIQKVATSLENVPPLTQPLLDNFAPDPSLINSLQVAPSKSFTLWS